MTTSIYPDFTNASRKPPVGHSSGQRLGGSKHTVCAIAASGSTLAIGGHTTRIWDIEKNACLYAVDPAMPNENNDKVRSMAFAPCRNPANEGHYLWVGMQDGMLMVLDANRQMILGKRTNFHSAPVLFIMRHKNTEMWTIDESGLLKIWPALAVDCDQHDPLDINPGHCQVTSKAVAAVKVDSCLFMSTGRTLESHEIPLSKNPIRKRIPNDLGNITQLAAVPYHYHHIFASHDNGKISIWDRANIERVQVITVSMYGISAMVGVGDYYLWVGYNTGMIYVYDTRPEQWLVVKVWKAHSSAVSCIVVDDTGLILDHGTVQVVSTDSSGNVAYWDGLLQDDWQEQILHSHVREYCTYQDMEVMLCSWNIDATKPEKLANTDDDIKLREWLNGMRNPDIIVVGMQEIVDLESKKQTARSLFASRKKIETLQDADELLTHRYSLWHDYLVQAVANNFGEHSYVVKKTDQLVGLFSCIFVKRSLEERVSKCESTLVKTGMKVMNRSLHGNKGGIAIRFLLDDTSLCFVNCHLAAGQSHIQQRNADAEGILQTTAFSAHETPDKFTNGGDGSLVLDHEVCFLSGDLNYRIGMSRDDVIRELKSTDQQAARERLMAEDQLLKQRHTNPLFKLLIFQEPLIEFNPTYKYDPGTNFYDTSDKKRVPAWCDRILYHGENIHNLYYRRHEVLASDHRPISAGYSLEVKKIQYPQRDAIQKKIPEAWRKHLLEIVQRRKTLYVADYDACKLSEAHDRLQANQWNVQQTIADLYE
ncbi:Endonuclease/exonuclease/phosphatase [Phycomyces nitens]|nr:Endonuclease/exonuclease/phosphatase [Phycomyces nitens]